MLPPWVYNHKQFMRGKLQRQAGDTIVEVLIATAVIGMVIAGAFVVSAQNTNNVRNAQEHSEALQLLQAQIEQLRAYSTNYTYATFTATIPSPTTTKFCFDDSNKPIQSKDKDPSGNNGTCYDTQFNRYHFMILEEPAVNAAPGNHQFDAKVQWDKLGGGTNNEDLHYRLAFKP